MGQKRVRARSFLRVPDFRKLREVIIDLRESRQDPDPIRDKSMFDKRWFGGGSHDDEELRAGTLPHQMAIVDQLRQDKDDRVRTLNAATSEANNYLTTFTVLLAAMGLIAGPETIARFVHSPYGLVVWLPGLALIVLLRSHASSLRSHFDNYEGAGTYASEVQSGYDYANRLREYIMRRNADMQRAKRRLSLVSMMYIMMALMVCGYITVKAVMAII